MKEKAAMDRGVSDLLRCYGWERSRAAECQGKGAARWEAFIDNNPAVVAIRSALCKLHLISVSGKGEKCVCV